MCSVSPLAHQLITELRGDVLDAETLSRTEGVPASSLNRDTFTPFLFQYKGLAKHSLFYIDSRVHGNKARYVRRSCEPNATLRHYILDSQLRFGIFADREIPKEQEVTIPHDCHIQACSFLVECGCGFRAIDCPAKTHNLRLKRKQSHSHSLSQPQPHAQQTHAQQTQSQQTQSQPQPGPPTGGEEKTYPDTTIKLEALCPPQTEGDLESPMNFTLSKKRYLACSYPILTDLSISFWLESVLASRATLLLACPTLRLRGEGQGAYPR